MTIGETSVSLKNWQACLAIAQQRLANPFFNLEIEHSIEDEFGPQSISGRITGLSIHIMDTGKDLIRLDMQLDCILKYEDKTVHVKNGEWNIITSFQTIQKKSVTEVIADLADTDLSVDFNAEGLDDYESAAILTILQGWIKSKIGSDFFKLFTFSTNAGQSAGVRFNEFKVTTAFAKYSPEYSSFLLLMREAVGDKVENELVIDPHILPQGQTIVLRVANDLLKKTGGASLIEAAEQELTFRPRPMEVDIPHVSDSLRCWAKTIIDNVSIPDSLEFTSMQMMPAGLMLSATPLSLSELDSFTAFDATAIPPDQVHAKAQELFEQCVLFYMKEKYRTYLLNQSRPTLPKEVRQITETQSKWFEKFARLKLAKAIRSSDSKSDDPFNKFSDNKIENMLKEMKSSETFVDQTARLYSLAFCIVHPRISLYMEDAAKWKPLYIDYLKSDAYADALIAHGETINKLHEDNAKLNLFDPNGDTAKETLPLTVAAFMKRLSDSKWKVFLKEQPSTYSGILKEMLSSMEKDAAISMKSDEASSIPAESHSLFDAQKIREAIAGAGGAHAIADSLMNLLSKEAEQEHDISLTEVIDRSLHIRNDTTGSLRQWVTFAVSAAVLVILMREIGKDFSTESDQGAARDIPAFTTGVFLAIKKGLDIAKLVKEKAGNIVVTSLKIGRWLGNKTMDKLASIGKVTSRIFFNVKTIAAICGKALCYAAAALSIYDAYNNFKNGRIGEGVVSVLSAAVALIGVLSIELSWSGPLGWALFAVGAILALISIFGFKKVSAGEDAVNDLKNELFADGVVA